MTAGGKSYREKCYSARMSRYAMAFSAGLFLATAWAAALNLWLVFQVQSIETRGEPASVAYYAAAHRLAPIFALEGTDPGSLDDAVFALKRNEETVALEYPENHVVPYLTRPWSFLVGLSELEKKRILLESSPSRTHAEDYHRALLEEIDRYADAARIAAATLDTIDDRTVGLWAGTTSVRHLSRQLNARSLAAKNVRDDEMRRYRCLTQWWYPCAPISRFYPPTGAPTIPVVELSEHAASFATAFETYLERSGIRNSSDLPIVGIARTACLANAGTAWFLAWDELESGARTSAARFTSLDPAYFFDYTRRKAPGANTLRDAGVTLEFQSFNPYTCVDYAQDAGAVLAARELAARLRTEPLFEGCTDESCAPLRAIEAEVASSGSVIDSSLIDNYIERASIVLAARSEHGLATLISSTGVFELERRITIWRAKSPNTDRLLASLARVAPYTAFVAHEGNLPLDVWAVQRGYHSAFFFAANETFGPQSTFLAARDPSAILNYPLRTYWGDIDQTVSLADLPEFIRRSLARSEAVVLSHLRASEQLSRP